MIDFNIRLFHQSPISGRINGLISTQSLTFSNDAMRGSPIRNLSSTSPFKPGILRSERRDILEGSPDRLNSNLAETDYWRSKARHFEVELAAVSEDLLLNSRRFARVEELQEKLDTLLRQNNHLVEENETLLQVIQQKKTENEGLRLELDREGVVFERETRRAHSNLNILDQEHKIQIEKLLVEINRLEDQMEEMGKLKRIEIDGIKSKHESEAIQQIQNLRRSQQGNNELLELNIRNLRGTLQQKNLEIERLKKEIRLESERAVGQAGFLQNQIKKIEQQKQNEFELYQAEHQNNIGNLERTYKKNEEEIKNLYENKIRRLGYEIEEKKGQIEENLTRFRRGGKESEQEIANLLDDKAQLRRDIKDLDALRLKQLEEMTSYYHNEITREKDNADSKEHNTKHLLEGEVQKLRQIIEAKQAQNSSLMEQIRTIKQNEKLNLDNVTNQRILLENKFREMVLHYEREIQLLKIKTSKLYEADLQTLRIQLENQLSLLASENGKLKESLKESRDHLVAQLEAKVIMRRDYETRLREMNLKYDRQHQQLQDLILMAEKKFQNAHSQTSIRDIEHTSKIKKQTTNLQTIFTEKRNLENQIASKNKEIETLNLRVQKMQGYHEKQMADLEKRFSEEKDKYSQSLNAQNELLKAQVQHQQGLEKSFQDLQARLRQKEKDLNQKINAKNRELDEKGLEIARLQGVVQEMEKHHGVLDSKIKVEVGNIEKTNLQLTALMNEEKERLERIRESDKSGIRKDYDHRVQQLKKEILDLGRLIQNLRASYEAEKVRTRSLEKELSDSLKRLDEKGVLEEHVINIGLSNNYFKNVAEIFRKDL